jgi:hypothetical protein
MEMTGTQSTIQSDKYQVSHRYSHPYRVTSIMCTIDTVISPDDGHIVTRNMQRKEINILRKMVHQVGFIYRSGIFIICALYKNRLTQSTRINLVGQLISLREN